MREPKVQVQDTAPGLLLELQRKNRLETGIKLPETKTNKEKPRERVAVTKVVIPDAVL